MNPKPVPMGDTAVESGDGATGGLRGETTPEVPELFTHWHRLVHDRRSIRGFDAERDVSDSSVEQILECARWAPSSGNSQPWEFVVIRDPKTRARIADHYDEDRAVTVEIERQARDGRISRSARFRDAPVYILILGDPRCREASLIRSIKERPEGSFTSSLANVTYAIHLTAASLGLACQYVTSVQSAYMDTMLKKLLGIPEPLTCYELAPIGWPIKWPDGPGRRTVDELVHRERYQPEKGRSDGDVREWVYTRSRRRKSRKSLRGEGPPAG